MTKPQPVVLRHSGDLGDIVATLPVLRQLGGGTILLTPHPFRNGGPREPMTRKRADFLLPLLRAQPYVTDARFEENPEGITHDYADLRITTYKRDLQDSLSDWAARHAGIPEGTLDTSPWLRAEPTKDFAGRIVIARSKRYQTREFPWMRIIQRNKGQLVFIGTREEHHGLLTLASGRLPWAQVDNALQMAQVIASCKTMVANQSFPLWVGIGLGIRLVAECWKHSPDVRVPRPNAQYIFGPDQNKEFYRTLDV